MITAYVTLQKITIRNNFDTLTDALIFARSHEIGATFLIKEGDVVLAKGIIEEYKEMFYE
jgi:DNA/RNA endonuclease YhcR with UshA esterase domain